MNSLERIAQAEADFETAIRIVGGDDAAANQWAEKLLARYIELNGPHHRHASTEAKRRAFVAHAAQGARECAVKIAADGRAHYRDEHGLIVCTLVPDGSAGAFGYDRW